MILLDTCTLLWFIGAPEGLSPEARRCLHSEREDAIIYVSAISAFELGQKVAKGKLHLLHTPLEWWSLAIAQARLRVLPLEAPAALRAAALPPLHTDPFDRLLIATAQEHKLTLLTPDPKIHAYSNLKVLW
jgi:PIN domain nuclease of toxin-antitoxin system